MPVAGSEGPGSGLVALDALAAEATLASYQLPGVVVSGRVLRRLGRLKEARSAYTEALMLSENEVERRFIEGRLESLHQPGV